MREKMSKPPPPAPIESTVGELIDERKNVQTTPPTPIESTVGPCPAIIQN